MARPTDLFTIVSDGYMTNNVTSKPLRIMSYPLISLQWWISAGTPTGSIKVQICNQTTGNIETEGQSSTELTTYLTKWIDLSSIPSTTITAGDPTTGVIDLANAGWRWIRLVYTATSGTGTLQALAQVKRNKTSMV
jgi:hypothetical protein